MDFAGSLGLQERITLNSSETPSGLKSLALLAALFAIAVAAVFLSGDSQETGSDSLAKIQLAAITDQKSDVGYWGIDPDVWSGWKTHSNRLIPVYTFGTAQADGATNLNYYTGEQSSYRDEDRLRGLYGRVPEQTVDAAATWMDQTDIARLQQAGVDAGKKYVFLVVFDGMSWQMTQNAAIYNQQKVTYDEGRGTGTLFQEYTADETTQFGFMVTSPHNNGTITNPTTQEILNPGGAIRGGYKAAAGGRTPWDAHADDGYLIGSPQEGNPIHAYTDSASSATSMMAGIKTYNNAIGVDSTGQPVPSIAHDLQDHGWALGVVTSVPFSHATPAAAYSHNVTRKDYQDISRDLLGLPSVSHPEPLAGLDVVIGAGYGVTEDEDEDQGDNYESGNKYLADSDLKTLQSDGRYVVALRTASQSGQTVLRKAARIAVKDRKRLFGFFGTQFDHLPYETADGAFNPMPDVAADDESYTEADLKENPDLAEMTRAALQVLESRGDRFWMLMEAGDVDWASHANNLDHAIGAVNSGDRAVQVIVDWVEKNSNWDESLMIVTSDHGHLFQLKNPELLINSAQDAKAAE